MRYTPRAHTVDLVRACGPESCPVSQQSPAAVVGQTTFLQPSCPASLLCNNTFFSITSAIFFFSASPNQAVALNSTGHLTSTAPLRELIKSLGMGHGTPTAQRMFVL